MRVLVRKNRGISGRGTPRAVGWIGLCLPGLIGNLICGLTVFGETPRPNVLIVVADDLGFSDLGCYGSEIRTPALDGLAANGVVFANFHAAATCSPTRAMLLTGVDHHLAGMGNMFEFLRTTPAQQNKPGYEGHLNDSVMTIAEVLKNVGYRTAISGKWHLGRQLVTAQAPIGRGFDDSWVLWAGWSEHFVPVQGRPFIDGGRLVPYPDGRYSTEWYTDKAIEFADRAIDQGKPFFLVTAYTAPHWPLEAPAEAIAAQRGKYDAGYEELRKARIAGLIKKKITAPGIRLADAPLFQPPLQHELVDQASVAWQELSRAKRVYSARQMEIHAAMIEVMDQQIGRLLQHLKTRQQFQNTLILFLSDNGAASLGTPPDRPGNELENLGQPGSFVGYGAEWARASTGPFRLVKGYCTEGGTRVPAIIKLPGREQHRTIQQFATVLDIAPTIYALAGAEYPESFRGHPLHRLEGKSMLPQLQGDGDAIHSDAEPIGWELFGRAAFRRGKWKITWTEKPFGLSDFELFDIDKDPGESRDLRQLHPEQFARMVADFEEYVRAKGVIIVRPDHW
jgi:arylsulfatase